MSSPLVTMVLTTRNRPQFLSLALRYFAEQRYKARELIVVDDSEVRCTSPLLATPGVRYFYLEQPQPLGTKLNFGVERGHGDFYLKMDDDDYYAADFIEQMIATCVNTDPDRCISFLQPFLFLDLRTLDIRQSDPGRLSGATLMFHRRYWQRQPFRDIPADVDAYFLLDHNTSRRDRHTLNRVHALESFLQVRHRRHLWNTMPDGEPLDRYLARQPCYEKPLQDLVPAWAYAHYRHFHQSLVHETEQM